MISVWRAREKAEGCSAGGERSVRRILMPTGIFLWSGWSSTGCGSRGPTRPGPLKSRSIRRRPRHSRRPHASARGSTAAASSSVGRPLTGADAPSPSRLPRNRLVRLAQESGCGSCGRTPKATLRSRSRAGTASVDRGNGLAGPRLPSQSMNAPMPSPPRRGSGRRSVTRWSRRAGGWRVRGVHTRRQPLQQRGRCLLEHDADWPDTSDVRLDAAHWGGQMCGHPAGFEARAGPDDDPLPTVRVTLCSRAGTGGFPNRSGIGIDAGTPYRSDRVEHRLELIVQATFVLESIGEYVHRSPAVPWAGTERMVGWSQTTWPRWRLLTGTPDPTGSDSATAAHS